MPTDKDLKRLVRQRMAAHSDAKHSLTYAGIEPLPLPEDWHVVERAELDL